MREGGREGEVAVGSHRGCDVSSIPSSLRNGASPSLIPAMPFSAVARCRCRRRPSSTRLDASHSLARSSVSHHHIASHHGGLAKQKARQQCQTRTVKAGESRCSSERGRGSAAGSSHDGSRNRVRLRVRVRDRKRSSKGKGQGKAGQGAHWWVPQPSSSSSASQNPACFVRYSRPLNLPTRRTANHHRPGPTALGREIPTKEH